MAETLLNGRYIVERKLGEGGMGEVWKVRDSVFGDRPLAYKLLKAPGGNAASGGEPRWDIEYFKHEFKVLARLDHPNLVKVYDFGITDGGCYYTCEFLEGSDLYRATEGLDWDGLYEITCQILEALSYIHDRGLVHYDVKPENVNVRVVPAPRPGQRPSFVVKLVDFGLTGEATTRSGGKIKGTVHYLAPEVAKEQPADRRADLYSLGITLYYCVTRKLPYDGGSAFSVIRKHLERIPEPPTQIRHDVPEAWARFILKLLEKDPADRFPTAEAALAELSKRLSKPAKTEKWLKSVSERPPAAAAEGQRGHVLSTRFVGRARELDLLGRALPDPGSRERDAPLVVLVAGEGGIGKSRLLEELKVVSQLRGVPFLRAECRETGGAAPLETAVRQVLLLDGGSASRAPELPPRPPSFADREERSSDERAALPLAPIPVLARECSAELEALFPGITVGTGDGAQVPREHDRRLVHDRVAHFLVRAAKARPFTLVVEDVHWADDATLGLLEALARHLLLGTRPQSTRPPPPLLLLLTLRPEESARRPGVARLLSLVASDRASARTPSERELVAVAGGGGTAVATPVVAAPQSRALRLDLARLDAADTTSIVASMLALPAPDEALGRKLHEATGGNPFFVAELVRSLLDEGVLALRRGLSSRDDLRRVEPPRTLHELLGKRLATLGADARAVLAALAVLGRPSTLAILGPTADLPIERALDALDALAEKQLAQKKTSDPDSSAEEGPVFQTAHAQIARAALKEIDPKAEKALHARAAAALERHLKGVEREAALERLARHFSLAGDDSKALEYSLAAAERAERAHRSEEAIVQLERALEVLRAPGRDAGGGTAAGKRALELSILEKLAQALSTIGRYADALSVLEALAKAGDEPLEPGHDGRALDPEAAARIRRRLGAVALKRGDYGTATTWLKEALERLGERPALRRERAKVLETMARIGLWRGDYLSSIQLASEALGLFQALKATRERLPCLNVLSAAEYYRGRYTRAAELLRESLELSRAFESAWKSLLGDLGLEIEADQAFANALQVLNRPGAIRRVAGDAYGIVLSFNELGTYFDLRGDASLNIRFYETSHAVYERIGHAQGMALSQNNLAVYRRFQGDHALALQGFERALAVLEGTNDRQGGAVALQNLAMLRLSLGDLDGAESQARRALAQARELGIAWMTGHSHRVLGRVASLRGDHDLADRELTRAEGVFRRLGNPRSLGDILLDRAELALDRRDLERTLDLTERARRTGEEEKSEDFLARQRLIAGRTATDHGRAIDDFEAALGYADAIGLAELRLESHRALVDAHAKHGTLRLALRHADRARELEERLTNGLPPELRERAFRFAPSVRAREAVKRLQERLLAEGDGEA
jgi:tetratricopeptide (TPR) repeat protein